ncbi:predicted protein [Arabidopsis lyrata subsp. lyrata]|uniref:Predicted protein n=1 Tax=Arabidopsis lyrata subsp. lyrata TaxID=81972 RepID=D7M2A6_ARALL|nr:predicted protein [Arabidopsis lyrata subsp. lyrata]
MGIGSPSVMVDVAPPLVGWLVVCYASCLTLWYFAGPLAFRSNGALVPPHPRMMSPS